MFKKEDKQKNMRISHSELSALEGKLQKAKEDFSITYDEYLPFEQHENIIKNYIIPNEKETMIGALNNAKIIHADKIWDKAMEYKTIIDNDCNKSCVAVTEQEMKLIKHYAESYQKEFFTSMDMINLLGEYTSSREDTTTGNHDPFALNDEFLMLYQQPYTVDSGELLYSSTLITDKWKHSVFFTHAKLFYELNLPYSQKANVLLNYTKMAECQTEAYERLLEISDYNRFALIDNNCKYKDASLQDHNPGNIHPLISKRVEEFCFNKNYYTSQNIYHIIRKSGRPHNIEAFTKLLVSRSQDISAPSAVISMFGFCYNAEIIGPNTTKLCFEDPTGTFEVTLTGHSLYEAQGHVCAYTEAFDEGATVHHPFSLRIYPISFGSIDGDIEKDTKTITL